MADTAPAARGGFRGGFGSRGGGDRGGPRGRGRGGRGRGRGRGRGKEDSKEWIPVTKLGRLVRDGKIESLEHIYLFSLPIKEYEIIDKFLGVELKDEVLKIMPVQKQTRAGQRTRFKAFVAIGDYKGHIGLGVKCSKEVATAIRGAIILAKLSVVPVRRGYWGNKIGDPHTVPCKVTGKCGSVQVRLIPAPRGTGIVSAPVPKKLLQMAGIEDCYTSARGSTCTLGNFAKATYAAIAKTYAYLTPDLWHDQALSATPQQLLIPPGSPSVKPIPPAPPNAMLHPQQQSTFIPEGVGTGGGSLVTVHSSSQPPSSGIAASLRGPSNPYPLYYFNIEVNGSPHGRIVIEVRPDAAPKMAKNFSVLATGEVGVGYKGCTIFQCWEGESVITGDFELNNGRVQMFVHLWTVEEFRIFTFLRMMEEVDNIIIHSLRQIGCDIEENITNLSGFNTELIIKATVKCLDVIRPGLGLSTVLPINMAARFRLGATLAQACLELGYKADVGYQTFLYSSETDLRKVFMFLIEKLPKESDKSLSEPVSNIVLLEKSISRAIAQSLSAPWLPHYCHTKGFRNKGRAKIPYKSVNLEVSTIRKEENKEEYQDYCIHYLQSVPEQMQNEMTLLPSLISYNAKALHSHSMSILDQINWLNEQYCDKITEVNESSDINILNRISIQDKTLSSNEFQMENNNVKETKLIKQKIIDKTEKQDLQIEKIKADCEIIRKDIEELQVAIKNLTTSVTQATINYQNEEKKLTINEEQKKIKARIYDLFQDGEENIKKLEAAIEVTTNKLINLGNQWEKHRIPLIQKYRQEREKHSTKANASQKKLDDIKLLKEKERELQEECRNKDQQYSQLVTEVQKLSKEVNRSAYTQRILEIINNIRKQRDEISKVLVDTREIQKEINTLTGRLERSFTVADELIFRDARTNEASRKAYKLLATLHSDCSELVNLVEETGATIREIRDLEEQIDSEATKNIGANLERITADLKQMKQETAELTAQLQNKNS